MLQIRPAELRDESRLFDLVCAFPTPTPPSIAAFTAALLAKVSDPSSFIAVAEQNAHLIGYVTGYCHPTFYASGTTAWVDELLVDAAMRGQGIGRKLMAAFEAWAVSRDSRLIALATSKAGPFYEQLGYESKASYYKKYFDLAT